MVGWGPLNGMAFIVLSGHVVEIKRCIVRESLWIFEWYE